MSVLPIIPTPLFGFDDPLNWARNGVTPPGGDARAVADYLNFLMAARGKRLFAKSIRPTACSVSTGDITTWRFAGHVGPLTQQVRVRVVVIPTSGAQPGQSDGYWVMTTGLTGAGSSTTQPAFYDSEENSGTIVPNNYAQFDQVFAVTPDTDYRFELHMVNGMRVISACGYEVPRLTVDPALESIAIDSLRFAELLPVQDAAMLRLFTAADKIWRRCPPSIFTWSVAGTTAVTRVTATTANILDQTIGAWSSTAPGFWSFPQYRSSLDSNNAPCVVYIYAGQSAGTGMINLVRNGATLAGISVTGAPAWYSATFNLDGTLASDKLDVQIKGDGTNTTSLFAAGAFHYAA